MNLLLILVDDLGYSDLGFMGNDTVETPRMDAFFSESVAFMRSYADSTCQPARAALMTGYPPASVGFSPTGVGLPEDLPTLPARLRQVGYRTNHIGKWHLGDQVPDALPNAKGLDYFFGFLFQGYLPGPRKDGSFGPGRPTYRDPWLIENASRAKQRPGHLTQLLADKAIERIELLGRGGDPWMMNLWFYAPHDPLEPEARFVRDDSPAGKYRAMLAMLDHHVGRVLDALDASGQRDRTLVVLVSDNGGTNRYFDNNAPFSGSKTGFFEGGIRTPMAMRVPGVEAPRRIDDPVSLLDIVATFLAAAKVPDDPRLPGRDLHRLLRGAALDPLPMYWEARVDGGYRYGIQSADGRWRYGQDRALGEALHDLQADPLARLNLVGDPAYRSQLERLQSDYRAWHDRQHLLRSGAVAKGPVRITERGLQRTPGFGAVTWGVAIAPAETRASSVVLSQRGVGEVRVQANSVVVDLFGERMSGAWARDSECHSVIVASRARFPGVLWDGFRFDASLFVDGVRVDQLTQDTSCADRQNREPLEVYSAGGRVRSYAVWTEELLERDDLASPGVARMQALLCPEPEGAKANEPVSGR